MDPIFDIELAECPICRGVGAMQDEQGWSVSVACLDCEVNTCPRSANCPTLPLWQGLDRVIEDYLAGVTLQDLIDRQREHSGDDYVI